MTHPEVQPHVTVNQQERLLGKQVLPVVFGTARYAAEKDDDGVIRATVGPHDQEVRLLQTAIANGYNFFDTAQGYGDSERVVSQATKGRVRDEVIVATKVGMQPDPHIRGAIESSFKRLGSEPDVLFIHNRWEGILEGAMDDCLEAVDDAVDQGLARSLGISNFRADELLYAIKRLRNPVSLYQAKVNLHSPRADALELWSVCQAHGIEFTASSALDRGQGLTDASPEIEKMARRYDMTLAQLGIFASRMVGMYPVVMTKNPDHMVENKQGLAGAIDQVDAARLVRVLFSQPEEPSLEMVKEYFRAGGLSEEEIERTVPHLQPANYHHFTQGGLDERLTELRHEN